MNSSRLSDRQSGTARCANRRAIATETARGGAAGSVVTAVIAEEPPVEAAPQVAPPPAAPAPAPPVEPSPFRRPRRAAARAPEPPTVTEEEPSDGIDAPCQSRDPGHVPRPSSTARSVT